MFPESKTTVQQLQVHSPLQKATGINLPQFLGTEGTFHIINTPFPPTLQVKGLPGDETNIRLAY